MVFSSSVVVVVVANDKCLSMQISIAFVLSGCLH